MAEGLPRNDDLVLIKLLKEDNELAFQEIYNSFWDKLFAYTYNRLHNREVSEEIVQDVFLSLWAKRSSIVITTGSLQPYLYGATKHRLLNELRSSKVRNDYAADYSNFVKTLYDNSNLEQQDVNDLAHSIDVSVSALPKQCQTVFRLSRQEHIPNEGIAQRLSISTKTVENYITKALKHIRTTLGQVLIVIILMVVN